ncbi:MAG: ribosome maturation factor RimM [Helicobacteraceae bacterium]|jgi:16S rRNA processing protein RimM|nr:ribosome maturation factor RimM [Helicobacteraceae bacterium]
MTQDADDLLLVAVLGRSIGLKGLMKLRIFGNFTQFFNIGATLAALIGGVWRDLIVDRFNADRLEIGFAGIETIDGAKALTNTELFAPKSHKALEALRKQFFWSELLGAEAWEGEIRLGTIEEIRHGQEDLLVIAIGGDRRLIVPMSDRFVAGLQNGRLNMLHTQELIEAL